MALGALGRSGTNSVGSSQWLENIINNQKFTGESLQPLKGNMSKYNNKLMASAKRKGYVGDFAQGSWT